MHGETTVALPGGLLDDAGVVHREVVLRALRGRDEEWIREIAPETPLSRAATEILCRGLRRLGPYRVTRQLVRDLPVADRDYLLLKLHELTFGGRLSLVLRCPRPECGGKMDLDLELSAFPIESADQALPYRFRPVEGGPEIEFRLPRGADTEEAADADSLLGRCVLNGVDVRSLSEGERRAFGDEIERVSPKLPSELDVVCPECAHEFSVPFHAASALFWEFESRRGELDQHLHLLSLHYHWPPSEILAFTPARRAHYVAELAARLERAS
jgi:hypothetical protein